MKVTFMKSSKESHSSNLQKLYDNTPTTNHFMRARIQSGMKKSKTDLAKTMAEYEMFKKYKTRTAISN
jgi:hypothetical protein